MQPNGGPAVTERELGGSGNRRTSKVRSGASSETSNKPSQQVRAAASQESGRRAGMLYCTAFR